MAKRKKQPSNEDSLGRERSGSDSNGQVRDRGGAGKDSTAKSPLDDGRGLEPKSRFGSRQIWLFRFVVALAIPVLLFIAVEVGLRVFDYGVSMDFVVKEKIGDKDLFLSNRLFTRRFFKPEIARETLPFAVSATKNPKTCRVFVIGESAAQGDPEPSFGIARFLEVMLRNEYPTVDFEVVNAGITAINSHTVRLVAGACARLDPDLIVVYTGNNEVTGPYGPGSVFADLLPNIGLIRAGIALRATRIGQLIYSLQRSAAVGRDKDLKWGGMKMFLDNQVRESDPRMAKVYEYFERNLNDICASSRSAKAPIIISTVGVNLRDCSPLASMHRTGLSDDDSKQWQTIYDEGAGLEERGEFAEAIECFEKAEKIDPDYAELQFRIASCLWNMKEYDKAGERYVKARDLDTLRFRTDTETNEVIRRVAGGKEDRGIYLVDGAKTLQEKSLNGIPGGDMFYEHVHLTFQGNHIVVKAIFEQAKKVLPSWMVKESAGRPVLSEEECAERLAYTDWDRYRIVVDLLGRISQPPFTNQLDHKKKVEDLTGEMRKIQEGLGPGDGMKKVIEQYEKAFRDYRMHWSAHSRYATLLRTYGINMSEAEKHSKAVIEDCPNNWLEYRNLGMALNAQKKTSEAEKQYRESIELSPDQFESYICLSLLVLDRGRIDEAIKYAETAVSNGPNSAEALSNMSGLLLLKKEYERALEFADRALEKNPRYVGAHINAANALKRIQSENNLEPIINHYQAVLEMDPGNRDARSQLAMVYYGQSTVVTGQTKTDEAQKLLEKALATDPDCSEAHRAMAGILFAKGDRAGAVAHLAEFVRINPNDETARKTLERAREGEDSGRPKN